MKNKIDIETYLLIIIFLEIAILTILLIILNTPLKLNIPVCVENSSVHQIPIPNITKKGFIPQTGAI